MRPASWRARHVGGGSSPPATGARRGIVGVDRSLRRYPKGAVVSVQLKGRPWMAVLGDMIEGVVVANGLQPPHADRLRNELWAVVGGGEVIGIARVA